jgi:hypothetical protein
LVVILLLAPEANPVLTSGAEVLICDANEPEVGIICCIAVELGETFISISAISDTAEEMPWLGDFRGLRSSGLMPPVSEPEVRGIGQLEVMSGMPCL